MSEGERASIINTGMFNTFIEAYAIVALKEAGFTKSDIKKVDFSFAFSEYAALEAKHKATK